MKPTINELIEDYILYGIFEECSLNEFICAYNYFFDKTMIKTTVTIDFIQKTVCDYFKISLEQLHENTRKRKIVQARQIAMSFSKYKTKEPLGVIGDRIGRKDHATVLHACKTVSNLCETDKHFRMQVEEIERKLR